MRRPGANQSCGAPVRPRVFTQPAPKAGLRPWVSSVRVSPRAEDADDDPTPVRSARYRFRSSADAAGQGEKLKMMRLLGHGGCFVIFAWAAPAWRPAGGATSFRKRRADRLAGARCGPF